MVKIAAVVVNAVGVDEAGNPLITEVSRPVEPFPAGAVAIVAGPDGYTVYEEGDVIP